MNRVFAALLAAGLLFATSAQLPALDDSVGPAGIRAAALHALPEPLFGDGVTVGILEYGGTVGEKIDQTHPNLNVAGNGGTGSAGPLATQAAGVINSNHPTYTGVAPGATLYGYSTNTSADTFDGANWLLNQQATILAHFDKWSLEEDQRDQLDGNTLVSLHVDYLAHQRDALIVVYGNDLIDIGPGDPFQFAIPTDAYNALTVNWTAMSDSGRYDEASLWNDYAWPPADGRCKPDLVAPGGHQGFEEQDPESIFTTTLGGGFANVSGARYAAAHVAGAAALLTQHGNQHSLSTHHNVLKAALINSADKTVTDTWGEGWLQSEAFLDETIPLDDELGAGQVDAAAAYEQYRAGEHGPGIVPLVGWDLNSISVQDPEVEYHLQQELLGGSYLTATLVWDRRVTLEDDQDGDGEFDYAILEEWLAPQSLNDLDVGLYDEGGAEVASSRSGVDNVEHLHWLVPTDGTYRLRVKFSQQNDPDVPEQQYALAWTATPVPEPAVIAALVSMAAAGLLAYGLRRHRSR